MNRNVITPNNAWCRRTGAIIAVFLLGLSAGCAPDAPERSLLEIDGETMGTTYTVKVVDAPDGLAIGDLRAGIVSVLARVDRQMSTYRADSEVSRFNRSTSTTWMDVSIELVTVIEAAHRVSLMTDGAFDVTVGSLVDEWGFGAPPVPDHIPSDDALAAASADIGYKFLHTRRAPPAIRKDRPELSVDLSAIAKGYAVDQLGELLVAHGVDNYLVEIGGELKVRGRNAADGQWAVAIEQPLIATRRVQRMLLLSEAAVATSGDYRNFVALDDRVFSHAINPRTGVPVTGSTASVTVVDPSAMRADALATALLVTGVDRGLRLAEQNDMAALFILHDGGHTIERATADFTAYLAPEE